MLRAIVTTATHSFLITFVCIEVIVLICSTVQAVVELTVAID